MTSNSSSITFGKIFEERKTISGIDMLQLGALILWILFG
jgi:hypothetical protein